MIIKKIMLLTVFLTIVCGSLVNSQKTAFAGNGAEWRTDGCEITVKDASGTMVTTVLWVTNYFCNREIDGYFYYAWPSHNHAYCVEPLPFDKIALVHRTYPMLPIDDLIAGNIRGAGYNYYYDDNGNLHFSDDFPCSKENYPDEVLYLYGGPKWKGPIKPAKKPAEVAPPPAQKLAEVAPEPSPSPSETHFFNEIDQNAFSKDRADALEEFDLSQDWNSASGLKSGELAGNQEAKQKFDSDLSMATIILKHWQLFVLTLLFFICLTIFATKRLLKFSDRKEDNLQTNEQVTLKDALDSRSADENKPETKP